MRSRDTTHCALHTAFTAYTAYIHVFTAYIHVCAVKIPRTAHCTPRLLHAVSTCVCVHVCGHKPHTYTTGWDSIKDELANKDLDVFQLLMTTNWDDVSGDDGPVCEREREREREIQDCGHLSRARGACLPCEHVPRYSTVPGISCKRTLRRTILICFNRF